MPLEKRKVYVRRRWVKNHCVDPGRVIFGDSPLNVLTSSRQIEGIGHLIRDGRERCTHIFARHTLLYLTSLRGEARLGDTLGVVRRRASPRRASPRRLVK